MLKTSALFTVLFSTVASHAAVVRLGPGVVEFDSIHVAAGNTLRVLPGTELVRRDVPGEGGIVVHGTLIAVRKPNDAPIVFRSANPNGHRAYLTCHGDMRLDGVEIRDFGRTTIEPLDPLTNPIGLYAVHWHLAGDRPKSFIKNCLVHDTVIPSPYRHGIVLHGTNGVRVVGNLIREKGGTGIFTEDGSETDNVIQGNTIEFIRNANGLDTTSRVPPKPRSINRNDFGHEGAGIWLRGPRNIVSDNTIRYSGIGVMLYFDRAVNQFEPINVLSDITIEDCHDGYQPWNVGVEDGTSAFPQVAVQRSYIERLTVRRCVRGMFFYQQGRVTTCNCTVEDCLIGVIAGGDYRQYECEVTGFTIRRTRKFGMRLPTFVNNGLLVADCVFEDNDPDVEMYTLKHNNNGSNLPPRRVTLRNCVLASANKIELLPPLTENEKANYIQLDQTFVEGFQGVAGDDFRLYFKQQAAGHLLPQGSPDGRIVGAPVSGLTNQQAWDTYGIAWGGEIAPCETTRTGIEGFVCPQ